MERLEGNYPVIPTPMKPDGEIDLKDMARLLEYLSPYVDGFTLSAGGGEFPSLTLTERLEMIRALSWMPTSDKKVIFCIGASAVREQIALAQACEKQGVHAVLFVPPFYYPSDACAVRACLDELTAATSLPIVYYDNPSHTRGSIPAEELFRVFDGLPILGYKMGDPDMKKMRVLASHPQYSGFCGLDKPLPEMWCAGAKGAIVNQPITLFPEVYARAWTLFREGQAEEGLHLLETLIMPFIKVASTGMDERYVTKWLLHRDGVLKNPPAVRPPQVPITPERERALSEAYDAAKERARRELSAHQAASERSNASEELRALYDAIASDDLRTQRKAVRALSEHSGKQARRMLIAALEDRDYIVRRDAARGLAQFDNKAAVDALLTAARDRNRFVRVAALEGLEPHIADLRVIETFIAALEDRSYLGRTAAVLAARNSETLADALTASPPDRRLSIISNLLHVVDNGPDDKAAEAARLIGKLHLTEALSSLKKKLRWWSFTPEDVKVACRDAIAELERIAALPRAARAPAPRTADLPIPASTSMDEQKTADLPVPASAPREEEGTFQ